MCISRFFIHKWCYNFNFKPTASLMHLYSEDSVMFPAFSKDMIIGKNKIKNYFNEKKNPKIHVRLGNTSIRTAYGTDIEFGDYDFIFNGVIYKARFNMITVEEFGRMKIIFHQSTLIK